MANENIGGISWVVDADTAPAINSINEVDKVVNKTEKSLDKLDKETKKTADSTRRMGIEGHAASVKIKKLDKEIDNAADNVEDLGVEAVNTSGKIKKLDKEIDKTTTSSMKMSKTAAGVNKGISGMGRTAGQAGIQMQQFIGQIQGGQNAMLALSAQSADLGFVLGAPLVGAVVGISASIIGMLLPTLFKAGESTEDLTKKIKELVKASTLTEAQSAFLVAQTEDEIKKKKEQIKETEKQIKTNEAVVAGYENLTKAQKARRGIGTKIEKENTQELLKQKASVDTLKAEIEDLTKKKKAYSLATKKSINDQEDEKKTVVQLKTALQMLDEQLSSQVATLGMSDRGVAHYKASLMGATDEIHKNIDAIYDHKDAVEADRKAAQEAAQLAGKAISIADTRGDPLKALQAQKDEELAIIAAAEEQGLRLHTDYATLRQNVDEQYAAAEAAAREKKFAAESEMNALALSSIEALGSASANVISGMLAGTMTARDAMLQFSNAILNEVIGSLVQIGVQYVKNALIEKAIDASAMTAKQAVMAAQAAAHTAAVTASVAELASLGAAGAIAATAAIPIVGPALAPAAGAAMAGIVGAAGAPAIAAAPVAGMREHGGSVISGSAYEVGEKNKPELLMIPGNNGKVLSNAEMKSMASGNGGGGVTVNLYGAPEGTSVKSRQDPMNDQRVVDIVIGQMTNPNSRGRRGMQRNSNLHGVLNGSRRS